MSLDPQSAAEYALIAISLILIGALITPGQIGLDQRAAVLAGIVTVLFAISYRRRRKKPPEDSDDRS